MPKYFSINSFTILFLILILYLQHFVYKIKSINLPITSYLVLELNLFTSEGFSMVIPSHPIRIKILNISLNFILNNPPNSLVEIIINWSSDKEVIESLIHNFSSLAQKKKIILKYSIYNDTTINRRFLDSKYIKTPALFSYDDDIIMDPYDIEFGFKIWKKHRMQIVGFCHRCIGKNKHNFYYLCKNAPINLVLTNQAFISKELALQYYSKNNEQNTKFVQELNNCEDILMNFVATNISNLTAVLVQRYFISIKSKNGISNKAGHYKKRIICINKFYQSFKKIPPPINQYF